MSESSGLEQMVVVRPRFARSISLVRDFHRFEALEGYILTSSGRDVLHRLADALRDDSPTRAWSLTGPYGSGKSAFALFAAQLLGGAEAIRQRARASLASSDRDLHDLFFGSGGSLRKKAGRLCPVLVTGSRQPLDKALAASLASALRRIARTKPPQIVERLERLAGQPHPSGTAVVGLFEEANDYLERCGKGVSGILLIVDELGKFLEYGAGNPEQGDVFVLQELAESATRSRRPFLFLTILHQSIDDYVGHLSPPRRAEWAKVQGRFEAVTRAATPYGREATLTLTTGCTRRGSRSSATRAWRRSSRKRFRRSRSSPAGTISRRVLSAILRLVMPIAAFTRRNRVPVILWQT